MTTRRKKNEPSGDERRNSGGRDRNVRIEWANIRLSGEDVDEIGRSEATLEYLSAILVSLVNDGFGVSVKPNGNGSGCTCSIFTTSPDDTGRQFGVSGFGGDIRSALLSCLLKFDSYLGRRLDADTVSAPSLSPSVW